MVEANVGIICTCLPFLKAFIKHVAPSVSKKLAMNDEPNSPTVFDRAAALASLPAPKSARRKSMGRVAVQDVPHAPEMRNWPLHDDKPFAYVEERVSLERMSLDKKSPHAGRPVDVAEMV